ncbi:conserved oligomeric Golgi complex subunit 7 isoform X1 [Frankliniella occidentalis]|uniref:Conserved oligomeric Golgi complex subunit 7 n=2 Tax=Frankliniella occidentalis TaxID=133901 RepID=A0A6J1TFR9_FRAOC|nr:conserved oligomeric Golgi complex subunit 7 isoform X1 [Frankliniella occidentalis]
MDMSAFSDDNFDAKDWINATFRTPEVKDNRDAFVSSLVMKLQLYVQQVNSALEETSQQVLQSLPRVMRDTDVLQQETLLLREKMKTVREEMSKVQSDTGESLATLEHIDQLKMRLQKAKQALHEADNWSLLAADLEEVFESGDIENMSSRLTKMQQSLGALTSVPDYEERRLQLEGLKNRLEAIASPRLVQAFTSGSIEQSRLHVRIFVDMDRLSQLLKYYHKCQKGILLQQWRGLIEVEQDEGAIHLLKSCYEMFITAWNDQVKWCSQVFTTVSPAVILVELFADTLSSLEPSLNTYFDSAMKEETDPLSLLLEQSQCTQHFLSNLQAAIEASCQGKCTVSDDKLLALAQSVYRPWIPYIKQYSKLESENLKKQISPNLTTQEDLAETVQAIGLSVTSAVGFVIDAQKRCLRLSHGCAYIGLLKAIKSYFTTYLDQFQTALKRLDKQKGNAEDWNMFQMCLTLLQSVGQLLSEIRHLDKELLQSILNISKVSPNGKYSSFSNFKFLLLDEVGQKEFDLLCKSFQDGGEDIVLKSILSAIEKLCGDVHRTTFAVILAPIIVQLNLVQSAPAWCASVSKSPALTLDLPDYSFAPQEYITQVGQYLMTLPQHLEPFLLRDNPALTLALSVAVSDIVGGSADLLLAGVARTTCLTYCDRILGISQLSASACKQLATDIDYLGNVLEDLGLCISDQLSQLSTLLRIPADDYQAQSSGCQPKLVAAVRQMREITTS